MSEKSPNAQRWGGPGASHEDRSKPPPVPTVKDADDPDHVSQHSQDNGSGERDRYQAHDPAMKHRKQANDAEKRHG